MATLAHTRLENKERGETIAISHYLDPRQVLFLEASTRDEALQMLVDCLAETGKVHDKKAFYQAILERERIVSTGIGMGVAVPHAKMEGYEDFFIAIGICSKEGLEWNALDNAPVRLIFMIGGPTIKQTQYLKILSRLTLAIKDVEKRKKMLKAKTAEEVIALFAGY